MSEAYEILFYISWFMGLFMSFVLGACFGIFTIWSSKAKNVDELKVWLEDE